VSPVLHDVIGVNQDVVQVDYYTHIQEIGEHVVHKALEGGIMSPEDSFPFVFFGNADQVIRMLEVDLGVNMSFAGGI